MAAMNYAETQVWDKTGTFSGSGVGIGSGGIGIGMGGGTFTEHGEEKSKRAAVFREPERYALPFVGVLFAGLFAAFFLSSGADVVTAIAPPVDTSSGNPMDNLAVVLLPALKVIGPIAGLAIFGTNVFKAFENQKEEDRLNNEVLPKEVRRYNELRYCESCNLLFDAKGRSAEGSAIGFKWMMAQPT